MVSINPRVLEYVRAIKPSEADWRPEDEQQLRCLYYFFTYVLEGISHSGNGVWRCSFRQRETTCLLVVGRVQGDIPQVVFITGRTPTDFILIYIRKLVNDTLEWQVDRYG